MREIAVAAVQIESYLGDCERNADKHAEWVSRAAGEGADLVFFPECSLTGYTLDGVGDVTVRLADRRVEAVREVARECGIAVGFGLVEQGKPGGNPFVTYVVYSGQDMLEYRKTHLGSSERDVFAQGDCLPVADIAGVCVGVQLCWEGRIPEIATTLRSRGTQLLLAPHASGLEGERRVRTWSRYLPARALDNGMFVIACNALRRNSAGRLAGGGMAAYGPHGELLSSYDRADEHMMLVSIGGMLPRETPDEGMRNISYFDRRRPELYERGASEKS